MKTIFISSFHGHISRNLLDTDALKFILDRGDIRVIIFVLAYKAPYFQKKFAHPRIIIEGVSFGPASNYWPNLAAKRLAKFGLNSDSVKIQRYLKWRREGKFGYFLGTTILSQFFRLAAARHILRFWDFYLAPKARYRKYFERWRPDAVIITDIQNERDVELAQNARYFKTPLLGMVRSWDNLSTHGLLRILPDILLVTCPRVREQAIRWNDMLAERIKIIGISHYDKYFHGPIISREEFLQSLGLDPLKKTILYAPVGDIYTPKNDTDGYVFEILGGIDAQMIVRTSPSVPILELMHVSPFPNMVFDRPGVNFKKDEVGDQELSSEDDDRLMHELAFCDLVVCGPSTICLDSVFFNKPVVLLDLYCKPKKYFEKIPLYGYTHFRYVLEKKAAEIARSKEELEKEIRIALDNPALHADERVKVLEAYAGPYDGKAGHRFANAVIQFLGL